MESVTFVHIALQVLVSSFPFSRRLDLYRAAGLTFLFLIPGFAIVLLPLFYAQFEKSNE
jgi:hypothetical protein